MKIMKIEDTQAYKRMNDTQQRVTLMRSSIQRISNNVGILKTIGLDRWEKVSTGLPNRWKSIVKEIAEQ